LLRLLTAAAGATAAADCTGDEVELLAERLDERAVEVATSLDNVEGKELNTDDDRSAFPDEETVGYD
jgi:hypothetical protein